MATTEQSSCPMHDLEDSYNPFVAPQLNDPYPVWSIAREEPVFHSSVLDAWVVTRYDDIVSVLRDPERFGQVAELKMVGSVCPEAEAMLAELPTPEGTMVLQTDPPIHTKLRRYLQPAFMPHKIAHLEADFRAMANELIDDFAANGHGDFYSDYAYRYPLYVVCHLLGLGEELRDQIKEWAGLRMQFRYANLSPDDEVVAARAVLDYFQFALDLVAKRRAEPGDDVLSLIVAENDASDDPLLDTQLAAQVNTMLTAGHETTALWLTITLHRLLEDPERWSALAADPSASDALVEESLRMDGPVQAIWRRTKVDAEVGGVRIPMGDKVSLVLSSANADGQVFEDPEVFDAARSNASQHITFGRGIHTCIGAGLARMEGRISFEVLATRFPQLRLAADDGFMFKPSATTRSASRLLVEWDLATPR